MRIKKCSVVGLGKLGVCMAVAMACKGFRVIAVDRDLSRVSLFNRRRATVFEPGLQEMLEENGSRIYATGDYRQAVLNSDATFIVVPTPSNADGGFSLKYVNQAASEIGRALSEKLAYHLVVVTSTVLPGSVDSYIKPVLEHYSGKKCGRDFGLCYNPEFIALGTVIMNFLNPDFILIGESDKRAGQMLQDFYKKACDNNPPASRMNFINAELAKIAVNSFITSKITFANMLAELAENLPGADVDVITAAAGLDSRIGIRYLKGGLGYGGPCFPRDNAALASVAKNLNVPATIPYATDKFNCRIVERLFNIVYPKAKTKDAVGILGLSYKPLSNIIEESQGFQLARKLIEAGVKVILYDPLAMDSLNRMFGNKAIYAKSAQEVVHASDIIVIANPDPEFLKLTRADFLRKGRHLIIIDCWRFLRRLKLSNVANIQYLPFGIGTKINEDSKAYHHSRLSGGTVRGDARFSENNGIFAKAAGQAVEV